MRHVQERGFAIDEQELEAEINAVAVPIFDLSDQPIASVAVAGPAYRLTRERVFEIGPAVVATARDIAQEIEMAAHPEVHPAEGSPADTGAGVQRWFESEPRAAEKLAE